MKRQRRKGSSGRPKAAPESVRRLVVGVRLNSAELDEIQRKADGMGLQPSAWMRLAALSRMAPRPPVPQLNRQAYAELSRLAGNLNQLALAAHEGRISTPPVLLVELRDSVQVLRLELLGAAHDSEDGQG